MRSLITALGIILIFASSAGAQLSAESAYVGLNRPLRVRVEIPSGAEGPVPEVRLYRAGSGEAHASAPVAEGLVDLAAMMPVIWSARTPELSFAQLFVGEAPLGAPLVLQPLLSRGIVEDQLSAALREAFERGDIEQVRDLASLPGERRARLRQQVRVPEGEPVYSGLRVWRNQHVVFETTAGEIEIRLRPDMAPNTSYHVMQLAGGGLYDGTIFHRIINSDGRGRRFLIQGGDPLGLGSGGPGFRIDYEPSPLAHDYGIVSLARMPLDPNSGGSQFFICLGREACQGLDGAYTSFGEIVRGAEAVETISRVPVGPLDPDDPASRMERPLDPPRILRARLVDAPPVTSELARIQEPQTSGER